MFFLPARKSTRRQKAAVCVVEYVGVFSRYIYPIRYVDASVFTHARPRQTPAERKLFVRYPIGLAMVCSGHFCRAKAEVQGSNINIIKQLFNIISGGLAWSLLRRNRI
jgi:hypothetical protein